MDNETILTLHPDSTKQGVRINRAKYDLVRNSILKILREQGAQTFASLSRMVEAILGPTFDGSVMWYFTTVKLDLEARGEIQRVPRSSPQQLELGKVQK